MKIVSTSYTNTPEFNDPNVWLSRISFYTGILEELAKEHEVHSIEQISYEGRLQGKAVEYYFLRLKNPDSYFPFRLNRYIKKLRPDVVLVNGFIFPLQIMQLKMMFAPRAKIMVINRAERPGTGKRGLLQKMADRCVSRYFFTSKEQGSEWVRHRIISDHNKIAEVIGASSFFSVMDSDKARAVTGVTGNPVFLWVGRLDDNKDPMTVIRAFESFIVQQPRAKLYMIYHTEELKGQIIDHCKKNVSLLHAVEMIGKIPHEELQYWYSSAGFIISASHDEGSGIAVCEAMSCGCIPILSNIPSFRKMTGNGQCGFLYEPGDDRALLKILERVAGMSKEEEREKVLAQFKKELSFEAIGKKINAVIHSL